MFNRKSHLLLLIVVLGAVICSILLTPQSKAAPLFANSFPTLTDDAYTDVNDANSTHDDELLLVSGSTSTGSFVQTRYIYLKFDLSTVTHSITKARLSLATLTCNGVDAAAIVVDAAQDDYSAAPNGAWQETGVTWNNQPALDGSATSPLATLDAGTTTANDAGYYHWTDNGTGNLAAWLESERNGDDIVTLRLAITTQNILDVSFEDGEETGKDAGCTESQGPPVLEVTDTTLDVTLASFTAISQPDHVLVDWATVAEQGNLGFNVLRSTSADGAQVAINSELIPSQAPGSGQGASYSFEDSDVEDGTTYYYWLEDVDTSGTMGLHGPVSVTYNSSATAVQVGTLGAVSDSRWGSPWANGLLGTLLLAGAGYVWHRRRRASS